MNLYLIVLLLLAAGAVLEWFKPKYQQKIFTVCWCVTTAVVALRFGQGTDYATYEGIYRTIPAVIDLSKGYICGFYPEMGWRLFCAFFKLFQAPFWTVTMAAAVIEMLLLDRFLKKYGPVSDYGTVSVLSGADLCLHGIGAASGHGDLYLLRTGASVLSGKEMDPVCDRCIDRGIVP